MGRTNVAFACFGSALGSQLDHEGGRAEQQKPRDKENRLSVHHIINRHNFDLPNEFPSRYRISFQ